MEDVSWRKGRDILRGIVLEERGRLGDEDGGETSLDGERIERREIAGMKLDCELPLAGFSLDMSFVFLLRGGTEGELEPGV